MRLWLYSKIELVERILITIEINLNVVDLVGKDSEVLTHEYKSDCRVAFGLVADSEVIFSGFGNLSIDKLVFDEIGHKVLLLFPDSPVYGDFIRVLVSHNIHKKQTLGIPFYSMFKRNILTHKTVLCDPSLELF